MNSSHHHDPSSSVNSADAESHHGTPETKLTALSPDELHFNHFSTTQGAHRSNQPPAFSLGAVPAKGASRGNAVQSSATGFQDPFVTTKSVLATAGSSHQPKLSAIAPSFTPQGHAETIGRDIFSHTLVVPGVNTSNGVGGYPSTGLHAVPVIPETPYGQLPFEGYHPHGAISMHRPPSDQTSPFSMHSPMLEHQQTKSGQFSSDGPISRLVMVSHIDHTTPARSLETIFNQNQFRSRKDLILENLSLTGTAYVSFTDIRDASEAVTALREFRKDWLIQYLVLPSHGPCYQAGRGSNLFATKYEGQLCVKAEFSGPSKYFSLNTMSRLILDLLSNYGDIMAYDALTTVQPVVSYRAEFFDTKDADHAIAHLHGFRIAGCTMDVRHYHGDEPLIVSHNDNSMHSRFRELDLESSPTTWVTPQQRSPHFPPDPTSSPCLADTLTPGFFDAQQARLAPMFMMRETGSDSLLSPYARSAPPFAIQGRPWGVFNTTSFGPGAVGQERISPLSPFDALHHQSRGPFRHGGRHTREHSSGHHNIVEVDRIRQGADVRTTIMLRNIPNKIDQAMLKDIIDETSRGSYDFMYLRIDFANNCNVGYAFINFEDPIHIIDFVNARAGLRWNRFNSDKIAEVSYATIQGKDCLVQKFRNSSVMLEHPSFRPKIFRTGNGSLAGTEEPFPGPDNPSKMRRSVENAEHVGLFAPRAGQNFRDEQRRRRSQYDRGTRLAEIEDGYRLDYRSLASEPSHTYHGSPHVYRSHYPERHAY